MTSFSTTAGQYFTAICGLHAFTETMHGFTTTLMGLECLFHCLIFSPFTKSLEKQAGFHLFHLNGQVTTPVPRQAG
jgi:hypothetical protein